MKNKLLILIAFPGSIIASFVVGRMSAPSPTEQFIGVESAEMSGSSDFMYTSTNGVIEWEKEVPKNDVDTSCVPYQELNLDSLLHYRPASDTIFLYNNKTAVSIDGCMVLIACSHTPLVNTYKATKR